MSFAPSEQYFAVINKKIRNFEIFADGRYKSLEHVNKIEANL